MMNILTISLFIAVLATSVNPQGFQKLLLQQQLKGSFKESKHTSLDDKSGMVGSALALAGNGDLAKLALQSATGSLKSHYKIIDVETTNEAK